MLEIRVTNGEMVVSILVRHGFSLRTEVGFESRVDNELLADGMASEFPDELVLVAGAGVGVAGVLDVAVVFFELAVVFRDGGGDGRHFGDVGLTERFTLEMSGCWEAAR